MGLARLDSTSADYHRDGTNPFISINRNLFTQRSEMAIRQSHILYIEDHEDTRELVTLVLAESNCRVTTTCTIKDALRLAQERTFDLYILDSWLRDGTGIEFCKQLREFDQETPIMFLSGAAYEADKQAAMDSGAQRYLIKPSDIRVLSNEVTALILAFTNKQDQTVVPTLSGSLPADVDDRV